MLIFAAAFGRLCVETPVSSAKSSAQSQPPSGGCVLKHRVSRFDGYIIQQPPSGGCVLKRCTHQNVLNNASAAAFGRLCVETSEPCSQSSVIRAAAFGRLCVETEGTETEAGEIEAAAFGRLCVETLQLSQSGFSTEAAAFGRLCVETKKRLPNLTLIDGSRLRAAVC